VAADAGRDPPRFQNLLGGDAAMSKARTPAVYADAAYAILTSPESRMHGQLVPMRGTFLVEHGITDLSGYSVSGSDADLAVDLFVEGVNPPGYDA